MTQRTPRTRTIAATIGVAVLALAGTACSGSESDSDAAPSGAAVSSIGADQLTTGTATGDLDAVTWYGGYRPVITLDPIGLADYPEETAIPNMCEPLMRVTPDYQLQPGLAAKAGYTDDTHYEITIRKGVTFWDGSPMTAEDVAYSLGRNLDPKYLSNYSGAFAQVADVAATDADTVTVTLKQRSRSFEQVLGTLGSAVVEKAFAEKAGRGFGSPSTGVMCTGPFQFTSYDGTSKLEMTRYDGYWDADNAAHAQTFTFVYPLDPASLATGLESGKIDGALSLPSNLTAELQDSSAGTLFVGDEGSTPINVDLLFTAGAGPAADPKVRQALSMAIDRVGIAQTVFSGTADPLYKVSGPGVWGYARSTYEKAYQDFATQPDVQAASDLLDGSGIGDKAITFGYPAGDAESQQVATVVQQEAKQIGLTIKLVGIPNQQYGAIFADPAARKPYDLVLTKNYIELPEPMNLDALVGSDAGNMNFSGYHDDEVEASLAEADRTADDEARAQLVLSAEAKLAEALPVIPVVQPRALVFESSRLTGSTLTFSYMTSPWAAAVGAK